MAGGKWVEYRPCLTRPEVSFTIPAMDGHRLQNIRHLALDMDGTIYRGGTLFEYTQAFLAQMDKLGIGYTFLTNNSSKSVADYLKHLAKMGIAADAGRMYTSALTAIDYLREIHPELRRLFVLGTPSLYRELTGAGFVLTEMEEEPDAVLVGFDTGLTFERLCKAAWWIRRGKPYIGTHPDRVCPTDLPTVMVDCGSLLACLETATGRAPTAVLGKPSPRMLAGILQRHGLHPSELAMVGDRTYTDMAMAQAVGAVGVLVLTGETTLEEARAYDPPPDLILPSIRELGEMLAARPPCTPPGPPLVRGGEAGQTPVSQDTPAAPGKVVGRS